MTKTVEFKVYMCELYKVLKIIQTKRLGGRHVHQLMHVEISFDYNNNINYHYIMFLGTNGSMCMFARLRAKGFNGMKMTLIVND